MSRPGAERTVLLALLAAFCLLRAYWILEQEFDTDEAQHLHVSWEWTQGRVAYRDFFDNHTPLFQLAMAPLVAALGERADVELLARFAMLPLFLATLWVTYALGRAVFGARVAAWGAVLFAAEWGAFNRSVEVRPDALWTLLWVLTLFVLLRGPPTVRHVFAAGLLLGVAFGVSLKTVLLVPTLGAAVLVAPVTAPGFGPGVPLRVAVSTGAAFLAGALVVPAAIALSFAAVGAWGPMAYCVAGHNLTVEPWATLGTRVAWFFAVAILALAFLRFMLARLRLEGDRRRQAILVGSALLHFAAAATLWPMRQMQTFLPAWPVFALGFAAMFVRGAESFAAYVSSRRGRGAAPRAGPRGLEIGAIAFLLLVGSAIRMAPKFGRPTPHGADVEQALVADVLRLTDRSDYVMDPKGAAIFRDRPYYFALERITRADLESGVLRSDIVDRMIATRTCVVLGPMGLYPRPTRAWIQRFTIPVAAVRVAGTFLAPPAPGPGDPSEAVAPGSLAFETAVPATYAVVVEHGAASGTLDGRPYAGPRRLEPGRHVYVDPGADPGAPSGAASGRVAVVWAQAVERGFSPFAPVTTIR